MALIPWPTEPTAPEPLPANPTPEQQAEYDTALAEYNQELMVFNAAVALVAGAAAISNDQAKRLGPVAGEIVSKYLDGATAPDSIRDEAVLRMAGALAETSQGTASILRSIGYTGIDLHTNTNHSQLFRRTGCEALLTPYLVNRGGPI